jgi:ferrochelatase
MSRYRPEPAHTHGSPRRTGVLLVNLGTPTAPTAPALRRYLKQFLSDPRVVEIPKPIWWLILNGIILNIRPKKSAAKYAAVWMPEGSPLRVYTERQAKLVKGKLGAEGHGDLLVDYAMRYGEPSITDALDRMKAAGANRILVVPLYPQYAASTTASVFDDVADWAKRTRHLPALRFVRNYHDDPRYIAALAASVHEHWEKVGAGGTAASGAMLVMSFHGLPRRSLDLGDPYFCECQKTGRLLAEALGLSPNEYRVTFQSRFGKAEWLQPYTQATLEKLPSEGVKRVDVICPGFAADCLETLEEIAMECKSAYLSQGGGEFHYIPCLNDRDDGIAMLAGVVKDHLGSWLETQTVEPQTAVRAKTLGAAG